jgi:hypothetical protein
MSFADFLVAWFPSCVVSWESILIGVRLAIVSIRYRGVARASFTHDSEHQLHAAHHENNYHQRGPVLARSLEK